MKRPEAIHSFCNRRVRLIFGRRDFGHLEVQFTVDDPKIYTKPWTITANNHLIPDTELLEYFCTENEKDLKHMVREAK